MYNLKLSLPKPLMMLCTCFDLHLAQAPASSRAQEASPSRYDRQILAPGPRDSRECGNARDEVLDGLQLRRTTLPRLRRRDSTAPACLRRDLDVGTAYRELVELSSARKESRSLFPSTRPVCAAVSPYRGTTTLTRLPVPVPTNQRSSTPPSVFPAARRGSNFPHPSRPIGRSDMAFRSPTRQPLGLLCRGASATMLSHDANKSRLRFKRRIKIYVASSLGSHMLGLDLQRVGSEATCFEGASR